MKIATDGRSFPVGVLWLTLTVYVMGFPSSVYGQPPVPVQDVEDLGALRRVAVTLQLFFVPEAIAEVNPLYAYDAAELAGTEVHPDRIGAVATVQPCEQVQQRVTWCARYFTDIRRAFDVAYAAASDPGDGQSQDIYFATTYPLPNITPERRFVSGLSPW